MEVLLADFGDPDLIVVCETQVETRYLVFLEAKLTLIPIPCKRLHASGLHAGAWNKKGLTAVSTDSSR